MWKLWKYAQTFLKMEAALSLFFDVLGISEICSIFSETACINM